MRCPYCQSADSKVLDKRESPDQSSTRRRRQCLDCKKRFTTYEYVENVDIVVVKKDGSRERFDRNKLKTGIVRSCEKRPVSLDRIDRIVDEILSHVLKRSSKEVPAKLIGELVMKQLKKVDKVAYIRFASVYREFADLESFESELQKLLRKRKKSG